MRASCSRFLRLRRGRRQSGCRRSPPRRSRIVTGRPRSRARLTPGPARARHRQHTAQFRQRQLPSRLASALRNAADGAPRDRTTCSRPRKTSQARSRPVRSATRASCFAVSACRNASSSRSALGMATLRAGEKVAQQVARARRRQAAQRGDRRASRPRAARRRRARRPRRAASPASARWPRGARKGRAIGGKAPRDHRQHFMPQEVALEVNVPVALVLDPLQAALAGVLENFLARHVEQRTEDPRDEG